MIVIFELGFISIVVNVIIGIWIGYVCGRYRGGCRIYRVLGY